MAANGFSVPIFWRSGDGGKAAGGGEAGTEDRGGRGMWAIGQLGLGMEGGTEFILQRSYEAS